MSDVKIFAPALNGTAFVGMMEVEPNGPDAGYVQRTDYNALAAECDALKARLAEAERLMRQVAAWREPIEFCAPELGGAIRALDACATFCNADSAPAVTCDHFPGQTVCEWCKGTGAIDAPTSADDPSCPDCDGEGHV